MALQTSGQISLNDIHIEAGGSSGSQASINDTDIRDLISKGSGAQMSFSEWYGASASPVAFGSISGPTQNTSSMSFADMAYLRNNSNSNKDVIMFGGINGALQYGTFGTNNRRSTWTNGGSVSYSNLPSQYYTTGNRQFMCHPITGTDKFLVITENWLGYSTGTNLAMYQWDGSSSSSPSRVAGWSSVFGNQSSFIGAAEDRKNPGNFLLGFSYLHNVSNYFECHFIPVRADPSTNSISSYYRYHFTSDTSARWTCTTAIVTDVDWANGGVVQQVSNTSGGDHQSPDLTTDSNGTASAIVCLYSLERRLSQGFRYPQTRPETVYTGTVSTGTSEGIDNASGAGYDFISARNTLWEGPFWEANGGADSIAINVEVLVQGNIIPLQSSTYILQSAPTNTLQTTMD